MTDSQPRILFVCTANIVRSPIAAAFLREQLQHVRVECVVESAGLREAEPVVANGAVLVLHKHGVDLRLHRTRRLEAPMLRPATLILGLEREHVREAVLLDPSVWRRTFTLKEIVRRGEAMGVRRNGESIEDWIARMQGDRVQQDLLGADPIDDVADPYGGPPGDYGEAAEEIDDLVTRLVRLVWPKRASAEQR